ncbi:MAG: MATE family efflux transporter [Bacteroidetes bacterium HGW-Bacteroidetes-11]|nr:MAG: MATE family efflux transporter [Bacteroidetes bacterium HGW-Bacteroidetes-11]
MSAHHSIPTYNHIWKISLPIILSLIAQNVVNVTDTAFLGRVGEVELGASAIAGLFYISIFMLGFGFGIGGQILIARRNGERNYSDIGRITDNSLYFLFGLGLLLFILVKFFSPVILRPLIASDDIYLASIDFLQFRIYGIFFAFGNVLLRAFFIGTTSTKVLTYNALIMAGANVFLDYALIFGNFGFPQMGIKGAALASSISEAISAVFFFSYTIYMVDLKKYNLLRFARFEWKVVKTTLDISFSVMLQYFLSLAGWFAFFMIIEKMGERSLAISNIVRSAYIVLMIPVFAFGSITNSLVSNLIGEGKSDFVIPAIKKVAILNFALIGSVVLISAFIPRTLISIYTSDPELITQTVPTFYVVMSALVMFSFASILFNGVSGTANTATALWIELATIIIYLTVAWMLAVKLQLSIELVWTSEYIYFLVMSILSYLYLKSGRWRKKIV